MASFETSFQTASVAAGATYNIIFTTGALGAAFVARTVGFSGTAAKAIVYKTPTGVTGGTAQASYRMNQRITNTAQGVMTIGATVGGVGTQASAPTFYRGSSGVGPTTIGTYAVQSSTRTLEPNTTYLLQFTNNDAGAQVFDLYFQWIEGK